MSLMRDQVGLNCYDCGRITSLNSTATLSVQTDLVKHKNHTRRIFFREVKKLGIWSMG